jgi:hypothetical protein
VIEGCRGRQAHGRKQRAGLLNGRCKERCSGLDGASSASPHGAHSKYGKHSKRAPEELWLITPNSISPRKYRGATTAAGRIWMRKR